MQVESLIQAASDVRDLPTRLEAVRALKQLRLGQGDAHLLCDLLSTKTHPAVRAASAQVLGFHGAAARFAEVKAELLRRAQDEADPTALVAYVFALRDTDGVFAFFTHPCPAVAIEAVMGVPLQADGLCALIGTLMHDVTDEMARVICHQLSKFANAPHGVVAYLMALNAEDVGKRFDHRVLCVFQSLPQDTLLDALTDVSGDIERTYQTIWPGIWRREQQRRLLDLFVRCVQTDGASQALIAMLADRIGHDGAFYNRYMRFVRALILGMGERDAAALVEACCIVGEGADRECLSRLAEVLVSMVRTGSEIAGQVQEVLRLWEGELPGIRVKALYAAR